MKYAYDWPTYPVTGEGLHHSAGRTTVELRQRVGSLQEGGAGLALHHGAGAVAGRLQHHPGADPDLLQAGALPRSLLPHRDGSRRLLAEDCLRPETPGVVR